MLPVHESQKKFGWAFYGCRCNGVYPLWISPPPVVIPAKAGIHNIPIPGDFPGLSPVAILNLFQDL